MTGKIRTQGDHFRLTDFEIDGAELSTELPALGYLVPIMGERPEQLSGKLSLVIGNLGGVLDDGQRESLVGTGEVHIEEAVIRSRPVRRLRRRLRRIGASGVLGRKGKGLEVPHLIGSFQIADGSVRTEDMLIQAGTTSFGLKGTTGLDGSLDLRIYAHAVDELLERNPALKAYVNDSSEIPITLTNTLADPKLGFELGEGVNRLLQDVLSEGLDGLKKLLEGKTKQKKAEPGADSSSSGNGSEGSESAE